MSEVLKPIVGLRMVHLTLRVVSTVNNGSKKYPKIEQIVTEEETDTLQFTTDGKTWKDVPTEYESREVER